VQRPVDLIAADEDDLVAELVARARDRRALAAIAPELGALRVGAGERR
jgi:hypothetical protein